MRYSISLISLYKFKINLDLAKILDIFSGVGSFGLECLSRGAKHVTFVENYTGVLPILKRNLHSLKIVNKYEILEQNLLINFDFKKFVHKFDLIFLDPPFKEKELVNIIDNIFIVFFKTLHRLRF